MTILLYQFRAFERQMGSSKFAAFAVLSMLVPTTLQLGFALSLPSVPDRFSGGPYALLFALFVQYYGVSSFALSVAAAVAYRATLHDSQNPQNPAQPPPVVRCQLFRQNPHLHAGLATAVQQRVTVVFGWVRRVMGECLSVAAVLTLCVCCVFQLVGHHLGCRVQQRPRERQPLAVPGARPPRV